MSKFGGGLDVAAIWKRLDSTFTTNNTFGDSVRRLGDKLPGGNIGTSTVTSAELDRINNIQEGDSTISASQVQNEITITSVDLAKSIVIPGGVGSATSADNHIRSRLTASTSLRLNRDDTNGTSRYAWTVVEFK